ncbi:phosphate/phosphite/phosphonate ABC transporter substrate-binding protein [uncultured Tateyamaria sp.]|uniref:phosphate/phosphite/phosphonate ABC transporter substrate-binding protein n=1 Tax=uncultured Tateyamaria sp. TaxID=455651 RepID=UPI0026293226|nr:phosphate/phosphite/phosphonate ABC transporter substrate-binding protein [uncultured Tateyamaria sp.]
MNSLFKAITVAFTALLSAPAFAELPLRVALLPDENAATVIQDNAPLERYLEHRINREIDLVVTTDYSAMIEAVRFGRIDLAYFGPASYTIAKERMVSSDFDIVPFAARLKGGEATYHSVIVAKTGSGIESLADLRGQSADVAFGDPASTSSHLAPKHAMLQAGLIEGEDFVSRFTGGHDAVAVSVAAGHALAGGLSKPIYEKLLARGVIDPDALTVIAITDPLPQYPWVMRTDLPDALQHKIRTAFADISLGTESGRAVLDPFGAEGFAPINDAAYDVIREIRASTRDQ